MKKDNWRLAYHLMPPDGWLNDPNGLCEADGVYHVYFQYAPNTPAPDGRMARTWGHYAGPDLINLSFKGVPFWPETLDRDGCYSGSALVEDDGTIDLYYTGNIKEPAADERTEYRAECISHSHISLSFDGVLFIHECIYIVNSSNGKECPAKHLKNLYRIICGNIWY